MNRSIDPHHMGLPNSKCVERPREWRRRVVIPARLRAGHEWSDACILNISSRGLMIHSGRATPEGSRVELYRGHHVIIARVVWRNGSRAGLQAEDRLPIEEIMSVSSASGLRLVAPGPAVVERRKKRRLRDARSAARRIEAIGTYVAVLFLAVTVSWLALGALARPFAAIERALPAQH